MNAPSPSGIAFVTDRDGVLRESLFDGVGVGDRLPVGAAIDAVIDVPSRQKWRNFIATVAADKAAFDWRMDLFVDDRVLSCEFSGADADGAIVVVATPSSGGEDPRIVEQLYAMNNAQSTALRDALKRLSVLRRGVAPASDVPAETPAALWAEQAQINNELVNLQRELAQRNAELKRSIDKRNELLGIAAHDLRSPIGSVRQFADVLLASPLDTRQRRTMTRIRDICDFMVAIVDDMLDLSALESGRLTLALATVDLAEVVCDNVATNGDLAAVKRIAIRFSGADDPLPVRVDVARFAQVLNNLLSNAVKFSEPGTSVDVTLRRDAGEAVVSVADRGQGIAANERDQLFEPFVRTSSRPTGGERSTGLGLAIVRRIVRAHDGSIAVDSAVGVGSTFEVRLPLVDAAVGAPRVPTAPPPSGA